MNKKYYYIVYEWITPFMNTSEKLCMVIDKHPLDWQIENRNNIEKSGSEEIGDVIFYQEVEYDIYYRYNGVEF